MVEPTHDEDRPESACTTALATYLEEESRLWGLVAFFGSLIVGADHAALTASTALLETTGELTEEARERYRATVERGGAGVQETMEKLFAPLFTHLAFQHEIENFLSYIAELLALVFSVRPEALKSSEQVKVEDVLRHESMDELRTFLTERRVERLAYMSLRDLNTDIERTLGFTLFPDEAHLSRAEMDGHMRNLIAHNRGRANKRFVRSHTGPGSPPKVGSLLDINRNTFPAEIAFLQSAARDIDARAVEHWRLPTVAEPDTAVPVEALLPPEKLAAPPSS